MLQNLIRGHRQAVRLLQLGIQSLGETCVGSQQTAPSAHLPLTERLLP